MLPDEELAAIQQPLMTVAPAILVPVIQTGSRALILLLWEFVMVTLIFPVPSSTAFVEWNDLDSLRTAWSREQTKRSSGRAGCRDWQIPTVQGEVSCIVYSNREAGKILGVQRLFLLPRVAGYCCCVGTKDRIVAANFTR